MSPAAKYCFSIARFSEGVFASAKNRWFEYKNNIAYILTIRISWTPLEKTSTTVSLLERYINISDSYNAFPNDHFSN